MLDAALLHQFLRNRDRHATRCLGEHAFGLGQQVNAANDLLVCTIFGPAAGLRDKARGEIAIRGVSNRERLCDGVRFHGTNIAAAALHGINNRIASCSLRSVEAGTLGFASQAQALKFLEAFMDFADHRSAGHRNDDRVRRMPPKLFGQHFADCCFASARNSENNDDHGAFVCGRRPLFSIANATIANSV